MKFYKYLKKNYSKNKFRYTGTIYGDEEWEGTGLEVAEMLQDFNDKSQYIDHPANSGRNGFYFESSDIHYNSDLIQECVFEALD